MKCIECDGEIPEGKWTGRLGFCGTDHYVAYMTKHSLWSQGSVGYSQSHMDKILERLPSDLASMGPFYDVIKYPWLDAYIKASMIAWVLVALSGIL